MNGYVEITTCSAGFRVRSVDENSVTFDHLDFFTLDEAERVALSLVVRDPSLGLVDRTVDARRPQRRGATTLERAVRLSRASRTQNRSGTSRKTASRDA